MTSNRPHALFSKRAAGALLHPTSLAGGHGIGDLGPAARSFVDWMHEAGLGLWQMLPIGPAGLGNSPYSGKSAFAGEPLLISLHDLAEDGLLKPSSVRCPKDLNRERVNYVAARRFKKARLKEAYLNFSASRRTSSRSFKEFKQRNRYWLSGWCDYAGGDHDEHVFQQYIFDRQWNSLRRYANQRKVRLIGDLPLFVELDSADVQEHPELFNLDRDGKPRTVTGAPPDGFNSDGQLWRHPHYRWSSHRAENWRWWTARFKQGLERFDAIRLDHFLGFVRLWHVPASARTARRGTWKPTPGRELLSILRKRIGPLPIIAEDLGAITPPVERLRNDFGFPGMRILQWAFTSTTSTDLPHRYPSAAVVYPGTHDNETATGWARRLPKEQRRRFEAYADPNGAPARAMVRLAMTSPAVWAISMVQDLLELPPSTRMNRPGIPRGNWTWRLSAGTLSSHQAGRIRKLSEASGRLSGAAS